MTLTNHDDALSTKGQRKIEKLAWKEEKRAVKTAQRDSKRAGKGKTKSARKAEKARVKSKGDATLSEAIHMLEQVVAGMRSGTVTVSSGRQSLTVSPQDRLKVRFRARQNHKCQSMAIRFKWPRTGAGRADVKIG